MGSEMCIRDSAYATLGEGSGEKYVGQAVDKRNAFAGEIRVRDTVVDTQPYRSGVSVEDDERLVPFAELMSQLRQREQFRELER